MKPEEKNVGEIWAKPLNITVYAGGFNYRNWYSSLKNEVAAVKLNKWLPTSADFDEAANVIAEKLRAEGKPVKVYKVNSMNDFVDVIKKNHSDHSIGAIYVIAHGKQGIVWFSGKPGKRPGTWAPPSENQAIYAFNPYHPDILDIKKKFTQKQAKIVFYACESGKKTVDGKDALQLIADTLGVEAQGFSYEIIWAVRFLGLGTSSLRAIRGYIDVNNNDVNPLNVKPDVTRKPKKSK